MHMAKVRTTINLNESVVNKAKSMGINISAAAEMGIINYIRELESIGRENNKKHNPEPQSDNQTISLEQEEWTCRDLNPRPPPCQGGDLPV